MHAKNETFCTGILVKRLWREQYLTCRVVLYSGKYAIQILRAHNKYNLANEGKEHLHFNTLIYKIQTSLLLNQQTIWERNEQEIKKHKNDKWGKKKKKIKTASWQGWSGK